jgi:hypothetical protein
MEGYGNERRTIEEMLNTVIQSFQSEPRRLWEKVQTLREVWRVWVFSSPEFSGFTPKTLTHNAAQVIHPNFEIL